MAALVYNSCGATTKLEIMEFGIRQWQRKIVKSMISHGAVNHPTIHHFTAFPTEM
jgi:hypothetical protein